MAVKDQESVEVKGKRLESSVTKRIRLQIKKFWDLQSPKHKTVGTFLIFLIAIVVLLATSTFFISKEWPQGILLAITLGAGTVIGLY